jgi:hypothetical protein
LASITPPHRLKLNKSLANPLLIGIGLADTQIFLAIEFPLGTQIAVEILRAACACQCLAQIGRPETTMSKNNFIALVAGGDCESKSLGPGEKWPQVHHQRESLLDPIHE